MIRKWLTNKFALQENAGAAQKVIWHITGMESVEPAALTSVSTPVPKPVRSALERALQTTFIG